MWDLVGNPEVLFSHNDAHFSFQLGGVIELKASTSMTLDGQLLAAGEPGKGPRAGSGAGGSVWIQTGEFYGSGNIDVTGGDVQTGSTCRGGGGAGGRVAIDYTTDDDYKQYEYTGTIYSHGGKGYECGGAGTVIQKDTTTSKVKLIVDNNNICTPKDPRVDWDILSDTNRGQNSFFTWLFDQDDTEHTHVFEVI